jgi:hypothetical protein
MKLVSLFVLTLLTVGCQAPLVHLSFPYRPLKASAQPQWFDMNDDGKNDFAITFDDHGRVDALWYDDDQDGHADRIYHLADYKDEAIPHAILLLDSVPFQCLADRYAAGEFRWFDPPTKVIPPFPSMTELCFTELLHAAPMHGMIDQFYDPREREIHNGLAARLAGFHWPWERYLDYRAPFIDEGFTYLDPVPWYRGELELARRAIAECPRRTSIVYFTSASGAICKYGKTGVDQVLDGAAQLCLQLLYERHGAIRISLMADHGHNLMLSKNIRVEELLKDAGFHPSKRQDHPNDVVLEINGLVTYAAVVTAKPQAVSDALLKERGINMTFYLEGNDVIARDANGAAAISFHDGKYRYKPLARDVLGYDAIVKQLAANGKLDPDGFVSHDDWFAATSEAEYPDAPARLWDAFHRLVINPPRVMFTTANGYMAGMPSFEKFITMKSTHGSLDQINSATFLMTMHRKIPTTMRTIDVMHALDPTFTPTVVGSAK